MSDDRQLKQIEASLGDIRELDPRFETTIERLEKRLDDLGTGLEVSERIYNTTYLKYYVISEEVDRRARRPFNLYA